MRTLVRTLVLALLVALAVSAPAVAATDAIDRAVVRGINAQRVERGLGKLRIHAGLARTADRWSASMARRGNLAHGDIEGRLKGVGPSNPYAETLALVVGGESTLARTVVRMWMGSPPHRAILLSPRVRHVGVGRAHGSGGWYVTADFSG